MVYFFAIRKCLQLGWHEIKGYIEEVGVSGQDRVKEGYGMG